MTGSRVEYLSSTAGALEGDAALTLGLHILSPIAETASNKSVGTRAGGNTSPSREDIVARLAAALNILDVGYGLTTEEHPVAMDESEDPDTCSPPDLLACNAGRITAEEVLACAALDRWPIEVSRNSVNNLCMHACVQCCACS